MAAKGCGHLSNHIFIFYFHYPPPKIIHTVIGHIKAWKSSEIIDFCHTKMAFNMCVDFLNEQYIRPSHLYLVKTVNVGFVADGQVLFELPQSPHAKPAIFLANRQQHWGDRVVELRNRHWIPGAQEHNVCSNMIRQQTSIQRYRSFQVPRITVKFV